MIRVGVITQYAGFLKVRNIFFLLLLIGCSIERVYSDVLIWNGHIEYGYIGKDGKRNDSHCWFSLRKDGDQVLVRVAPVGFFSDHIKNASCDVDFQFTTKVVVNEPTKISFPLGLLQYGNTTNFKPEMIENHDADIVELSIAANSNDFKDIDLGMLTGERAEATSKQFSYAIKAWYFSGSVSFDKGPFYNVHDDFTCHFISDDKGESVNSTRYINVTDNKELQAGLSISMNEAGHYHVAITGMSPIKYEAWAYHPDKPHVKLPADGLHIETKDYSWWSYVGANKSTSNCQLKDSHRWDGYLRLTYHDPWGVVQDEQCQLMIEQHGQSVHIRAMAYQYDKEYPCENDFEVDVPLIHYGKNKLRFELGFIRNALAENVHPALLDNIGEDIVELIISRSAGESGFDNGKLYGGGGDISGANKLKYEIATWDSQSSSVQFIETPGDSFGYKVWSCTPEGSLQRAGGAGDTGRRPAELNSLRVNSRIIMAVETLFPVSGAQLHLTLEEPGHYEAHTWGIVGNPQFSAERFFTDRKTRDPNGGGSLHSFRLDAGIPDTRDKNCPWTPVLPP